MKDLACAIFNADHRSLSDISSNPKDKLERIVPAKAEPVAEQWQLLPPLF